MKKRIDRNKPFSGWDISKAIQLGELIRDGGFYSRDTEEVNIKLFQKNNTLYSIYTQVGDRYSREEADKIAVDYMLDYVLNSNKKFLGEDKKAMEYMLSLVDEED